MITINQQKFRVAMRELFDDKDMFKRKPSQEYAGYKQFNQMLRDTCVRIDAANSNGGEKK